MNNELKETIYRDYFNGFTEKEIAKRNNTTQPTVNRTIKKITKSLEYRLNQIAIFEFEQYFIKFRDAIEKDINEITIEIEKVKDDDDRIDRLRDQRHQRRLDLWKLLGDGEMVLVLRKLKQDGASKTTQKIITK